MTTWAIKSKYFLMEQDLASDQDVPIFKKCSLKLKSQGQGPPGSQDSSSAAGQRGLPQNTDTLRNVAANASQKKR